MLGVTAQTVRKWARRGQIPSIRISNSVIRFAPGQVMEAIQRRAAQFQEAP